MSAVLPLIFLRRKVLGGGIASVLGGGIVEPDSREQKSSLIAPPPALQWNQTVVKCAPGLSFSLSLDPMLWWCWPSWPACSPSLYPLQWGCPPGDHSRGKDSGQKADKTVPAVGRTHFNNQAFRERRACSGLSCIALRCYQSSPLIM